jgi:hypothetical protein
LQLGQIIGGGGRLVLVFPVTAVRMPSLPETAAAISSAVFLSKIFDWPLESRKVAENPSALSAPSNILGHKFFYFLFPLHNQERVGV